MYAVTLTASFSTMGRPRSSHCTAKSFRISANRVNPQSPSSALNLCCAAVRRCQLELTRRRPKGQYTMMSVYGGIRFIPQHQCELYASIPVLRRFIFKSLLQVERGVIDIVAIRKEKNSPALSQPLFVPLLLRPHTMGTPHIEIQGHVPFWSVACSFLSARYRSPRPRPLDLVLTGGLAIS
jgi:hypothetical protein